MNPILDGWFVLKQNGAITAFVIGFMVWGAAVATGFLRNRGLQQLGFDEVLSLASAVWMPAALLLAGIALSIGALMPRLPNGPLILALPAFASVLWIWSARLNQRWDRRASWMTTILLAVVSVVLMLLRLAFVDGIALPAYFDSATHFGLIRQLVENSGSAGWQAPLRLPVTGYYHLGYHVLIAGLARLTGMEIASAMLLFGQVILAALPVSLYLLALRSTGSRLAGMFAVTLGALGWYMPAHAVNWGKYPALFGSLAMLGAMSLAYVASRREMASPARRAWLLAAFLSGLTAVLIHSRLGVVLIMLASAWVLSGIWIALTPPRKALWTASLSLVATVLVGLIIRDPGQRQLLEPFVNAGIWATVLVSLSLPLAFRSAPRFTFALVLLVMLLLAGLFAPAPGGSLLDRPLVEMLLPLSLSLLGAAGIAGFLQVLPAPARPLGQAAGVLLSAAVVANALLTQGFSASACCAMVSTDDLVALDWLRREAPADAHVAVAVSPVQVSQGSHQSLAAGADAGIWIQPLTGLSISALSFVTDFGSGATHALLCETGVDIVYAGGAPRSFDGAALLEEPQWYELRLQLPAVSVFEVTACGQIST
jgi:hypothetical protein